MNFIDTHAHLLPPYFKEDQIGNIIDEASRHGVSKIINVGITEESSTFCCELSNKHDNLYSTLGYHPHDAKDFKAEVIDLYRSLLTKPNKVVAIGEIGLDYYYKNSDQRQQKEVFRLMLTFAKKVNLPAILHVRDSWEDAFSIIEEIEFPRDKLIFHCFTGNKEVIEIIDQMGSYISITGIITFASFTKILKSFPLDRICLETDCPYLTPAPHRGKTNTPSYIPLIAEKLAKIKQTNVKTIAEKTTKNAKTFFNI